MIIDNAQQLETLRGRDVLLHPIPLDDRLHPSCTSIIAFGIIDVNTKESFIVSKAHPEGVFHVTDLSFLTQKIYTTNRALLLSNGLQEFDYDLEMLHYLRTNKGYEVHQSPMVSLYNRTLSKCFKTNALIDLTKLEEQTTELYNNCFSPDHPDGLAFYSNTLKQSLIKVQQNGIKIDVDKFQEVFGKSFALNDDMCYTQYNFYTTTGRPSNRFGGINFAALPKEDNTRECFISRFEDGVLLELDFNSYHPRLIADIIGYNFGDADVYSHLAQHYHNTDQPTKAQIVQAKEDTFRQLYGGIRKEYLNIPFFQATDAFSKEIWKHMQEHGYVDSLISGRRLMIANYKDITEHTLFNYYIQMYETETNAKVLTKIHEYLDTNSMQSIPILYTYDSILFDVPLSEFELLTKQMIPHCIDTEQFPVKLKRGNNYKNISFYDII